MPLPVCRPVKGALAVDAVACDRQLFVGDLDAGQFSDIAVENMADQFSVFVKNQLVIKATVRTQGFVNQQIPVRLILEDSAGKQTTVHTELIDIPCHFAPETVPPVCAPNGTSSSYLNMV